MDPSVQLTAAGLKISNLVNMDRFTVVFNPGMPSVDAPQLVLVRWEIFLYSNPDLAIINLPALTTCGVVSRGAFDASNCTLLETVSFPNYLPTNKRPLDFTNCALTEASVDHILARVVANPAYVMGRITLEGGTNSPPSATGLADVATLTARGVVVTHN